MSLAQDIRNAFDWRDRDALEQALRRVQALELALKSAHRAAQEPPYNAAAGTDAFLQTR